MQCHSQAQPYLCDALAATVLAQLIGFLPGHPNPLPKKPTVNAMVRFVLRVPQKLFSNDLSLPLEMNEPNRTIWIHTTNTTSVKQKII